MFPRRFEKIARNHVVSDRNITTYSEVEFFILFSFLLCFNYFLNNYLDKILDSTTHSFTLSHDVENRMSHKHYAG